MTRYAIRRQDGRFLTEAHHQGSPVWIWLLTPNPETTFGSMTEAFCTIWGDAGGSLNAGGPWSVIPVLGDPA